MVRGLCESYAAEGICDGIHKLTALLSLYLFLSRVISVLLLYRNGSSTEEVGC